MKYKSYLFTAAMAFLSLLVVITMVRYPQIAFDAALRGLKIWWDIVFPALLPFMIVSEIMMGFGVVHFVGVLLEPLMRPLFNVPGTGGFVMAMGLSSGYPVGPKLATTLREQKLVSRSEGERLVCFTSTADPLFIFGAVAVGFFHDASLGLTIAIGNYAGAILLGILLKFHDRKAPLTKYNREAHEPTLVRALRAMHRARLKDKRPLGKLMGDAVLNSFNTMFVIGGFIIIFSVMINFVSMGLISAAITPLLSLLLLVLQLPQEMSQSLLVGFFEVTQSVQTISELGAKISMEQKIALATAIVAWGGISVHAQVASIISTTDMRYKPYFIYKGLHALISGGIGYLIAVPLQQLASKHSALPAMWQHLTEVGPAYALNPLESLGLYTLLLLLVLFVLVVLPYLLGTKSGLGPTDWFRNGR